MGARPRFFRGRAEFLAEIPAKTSVSQATLGDKFELARGLLYLQTFAAWFPQSSRE
jgi:hypothetical protein